MDAKTLNKTLANGIQHHIEKITLHQLYLFQECMDGLILIKSVIVIHYISGKFITSHLIKFNTYS